MRRYTSTSSSSSSFAAGSASASGVVGARNRNLSISPESVSTIVSFQYGDPERLGSAYVEDITSRTNTMTRIMRIEEGTDQIRRDVAEILNVLADSKPQEPDITMYEGPIEESIEHMSRRHRHNHPNHGHRQLGLDRDGNQLSEGMVKPMRQTAELLATAKDDETTTAEATRAEAVVPVKARKKCCFCIPC